jgi:ribosomal protein S6
MLLFAVSTVPVYAQNVHIDEQEEQIRAEIKECEEEIMSDDSLTDASKTVEKRKCSSEIRKNYAETALTSELRDKMKIRLQNLQKCEDWHSQYQFIDEVNFKIQKNAQMAQSCITLYNDPLWAYSGEDRAEILSDKLESILTKVPVKNNPSDEFLKNAQYEVNRIYSLEKKIADLEIQLHNKDLIIREQMNVISNLANSLRNAIFDGLQSVYSFV